MDLFCQCLCIQLNYQSSETEETEAYCYPTKLQYTSESSVSEHLEVQGSNTEFTPAGGNSPQPFFEFYLNYLTRHLCFSKEANCWASDSKTKILFPRKTEKRNRKIMNRILQKHTILISPEVEGFQNSNL